MTRQTPRENLERLLLAETRGSVTSTAKAHPATCAPRSTGLAARARAPACKGCVEQGTLLARGDLVPKDVAAGGALFERVCKGGSDRGCEELERLKAAS